MAAINGTYRIVPTFQGTKFSRIGCLNHCMEINRYVMFFRSLPYLSFLFQCEIRVRTSYRGFAVAEACTTHLTSPLDAMKVNHITVESGPRGSNPGWSIYFLDNFLPQFNFRSLRWIRKNYAPRNLVLFGVCSCSDVTRRYIVLSGANKPQWI